MLLRDSYLFSPVFRHVFLDITPPCNGFAGDSPLQR